VVGDTVVGDTVLVDEALEPWATPATSATRRASRRNAIDSRHSLGDDRRDDAFGDSEARTDKHPYTVPGYTCSSTRSGTPADTSRRAVAIDTFTVCG
jgi:hypothetical protein